MQQKLCYLIDTKKNTKQPVNFLKDFSFRTLNWRQEGLSARGKSQKHWIPNVKVHSLASQVSP